MTAQGNLAFALALTTGAGLATTAGSLLALAVKHPGRRFLSFTLGFSAGVMVLVSFVELLPQSVSAIGFLQAHTAFLLGMLAFLSIDILVPHDYILQEDHRPTATQDMAGLHRTGLLIALGIGLHNLPEGMATLASSLNNPQTGIAVACAVALHNIPEGVAVSVPVYAATGSRSKAFWWSFLSGVSEPIGAGVAALLLLPFLSGPVMGWLLAAVGGVMVALSLDELIPTAERFEGHHLPIIGVMAGMAVMALSLFFIGGAG